MRIVTLIVLLGAGAVALCQSQAAAQVKADAPEQTPPAAEPPQSAPFWSAPLWSAPGQRDFRKLPRNWRISPPTQGKALFPSHLDRKGTAQRWDAERIDPEMAVHPGKERIGTLPPGTPIQQNQFPKLVFQPIGLQSLKAKPLSTKWPELKVQPIPTEWPKFALRTVQEKAATPARDEQIVEPKP
jgi:hypothetical protein